MKAIRVVFLVLAALLLPRFAQALDLGSVRVSFLVGDAQMRSIEGGDDWFPVSINTPLDEGDELWVPEGGRLEVQLNSGTSVRLDQNTALQILNVDRTSAQFYLTEGHIYIDYNAPRGNVIQIDTPVASLRTYDRAVFRVDVPDQYTDVSVFRGWVDAEERYGKTRVNANRTLTLGEGREAELAPIGRPDDWQNWNVERDRRFAARGDSYRYLPVELRPYSRDLDDNGRWLQVADYGYVWSPRSVADDWAPYRTGRWMWRGADYVWISYEPWGWTPYHYGRWAHAPRIGWFWVPPQRGQVHWGPGYVGWVRTPTHVAWVPLAPREVYYGYGSYGPNSVDLRRRDNRQINVTKITYRNVQVNNSVTVINHKTFVTGRRETVNVRENLFLTEKVNVGRPDIKPERASFAPVAKTIEPAKRPPQQVNRIAVKELRQERPLVKEQNQSVINRGAPVKPLVVKTVQQPKSPVEKVQERRQLGASRAPGETPRVKAEVKSSSPSAVTETKETKGRSPASPGPEVKRPESAREKSQERQQTQVEKGKRAAPVASPKVEEKSAGPSATSEIKETKDRSPASPGPEVKRPESAPETAQERQQTQVEKSKSAAPVASPKAEEKSPSPAVASETKETKDRKSAAPATLPKPASTVEPRDRKAMPAQIKSAAPVKTSEAIESKGARQSGSEERKRPVAAQVPEARGLTKDGKQIAREKIESKEEKAKREELESKRKSTEMKDGKSESR